MNTSHWDATTAQSVWTGEGRWDVVFVGMYYSILEKFMPMMAWFWGEMDAVSAPSSLGIGGLRVAVCFFCI